MLNSINATIAFYFALVAGSADFYVTFNKIKYHVELLNNGTKSGPTLSTLGSLMAAFFSATQTGGASLTVTIGKDSWTVTVTH